MPAKVILALAFTVPFSAAHAAYGTITAYPCNACSEQQYLTVATGNAQQESQAKGFQYVYDLQNNVLRKYSVSRGPQFRGWQYTLEQVAPDPQESNYFSLSRNAIESNNGNAIWFNSTNQTAPGFPTKDSTFEVAWTGADQISISNYLYSSSSNIFLNNLGLTTGALVNLTAGIVLKGDPFAWDISVNMIDGGTVEFVWHSGDRYATLVRALDKNMNPIPLETSQIAGRYKFDHGGGDDFTKYLNERFGPGTAPGNVCTNGILACSGVKGVAYSCTWISCGDVP